MLDPSSFRIHPKRQCTVPLGVHGARMSAAHHYYIPHFSNLRDGYQRDLHHLESIDTGQTKSCPLRRGIWPCCSKSKFCHDPEDLVEATRVVCDCPVDFRNDPQEHLKAWHYFCEVPFVTPRFYLNDVYENSPPIRDTADSCPTTE